MISKWIIASFLYFIILLIIILIKPVVMFDENGQSKQFGVGNDKSVLSPIFVFPLLGFLCYFIVVIIEFIYHKNK